MPHHSDINQNNVVKVTVSVDGRTYCITEKVLNTEIELIVLMTKLSCSLNLKDMARFSEQLGKESETHV